MAKALILKKPAAAGVFKAFPAPKKGKGRMIAKMPPRSKPVAKSYSKVPYVRNGATNKKMRHERVAWAVNLKTIVKLTDDNLIRRLLTDNILEDKTGKKCPFCSKGVLGSLKEYPSRGGLQHRCGRKGCQKFCTPYYGHPLFKGGAGPNTCSLSDQTAALFCLLAGCTHAATKKLVDVDHKVIENMAFKLDSLRARFVKQEEKSIIFGTGRKWVDVEADEATFAKYTDPDADESANTSWEQWAGIVERGRPDLSVNCVLYCLRSCWSENTCCASHPITTVHRRALRLILVSVDSRGGCEFMACVMQTKVLIHWCW